MGPVASELRDLRLARRLSLSAAAARADVPKGTLSGWEGGANRPRGPALARLLDVLGADDRTRARLLHASDPAFARVELAHSPLGAPVEVGTALRTLRARRGITQAELARRVGLTQSAVAHWEAGDVEPSAETVHAVAFALGASPEEALALASAQGRSGTGDGASGLPDDPEAVFARLAQIHLYGPLAEVVSLGWEADLWRRATRSARWDACLVNVLADRANWLVGQERMDEVAAPARRAVAIATGGTVEARRRAVPAVAALADLDRRRGAGHREAAETAARWAEGLPADQYRAWMLFQRGMSLARLGQGDAGADLVAQATAINEPLIPPWQKGDPWSFHTAPQCEARLAAGEPARAAALIGGRRERVFDPFVVVRVEHALGRAANESEMAYLRFRVVVGETTPQARRRLERIERRQAKLTGAPMPIAPGPTDDATGDRLWEAVLRDNRG